MVDMLVLIAANTCGWPQNYVRIGAVVLLGTGILAGVTNTKRKDPSAGG